MRNRRILLMTNNGRALTQLRVAGEWASRHWRILLSLILGVCLHVAFSAHEPSEAKARANASPATLTATAGQAQQPRCEPATLAVREASSLPAQLSHQRSYFGWGAGILVL